MSRNKIKLSDIDEKLLEGIRKDLEEGMFEKDAAMLNGVPGRTYRFWKKNVPEFKLMANTAILKYKKKLIQTINVNSVKSGKTGLEILRRRWPKEWNVSQKIKHEGKVETGTKKIADLLQKLYRKYEPRKDRVHSDVS